jgi:hypothetical protein
VLATAKRKSQASKKLGLFILKSWLKNCALRKGNLILLFPPVLPTGVSNAHIADKCKKKIVTAGTEPYQNHRFWAYQLAV